MKTYMERLKARTEEVNKQREQAKPKNRLADSRVSPEWAPLTEQIKALIRSLPPAQRDRPWSMEDLRLRLKGKFGDHPHPMHIGVALRTLGWVQKRDWSKASGDGRRMWVQRK